MRRGAPGVAATGLLAGLLLAFLSGCTHTSDASGTPNPTLPSSPVLPTNAAREQADRSAVAAAYQQFWDLQVRFDSAYPEDQWRAVLSSVTADPELTRSVDGALVQKRNGIKAYGWIGTHPVVSPINGANTAAIKDCQDASHAGQADARTGAPRSVGIKNMPVTATLLRGADGRWRVSDVRYPGGRCR
jgi:hypothetical protein